MNRKLACMILPATFLVATSASASELKNTFGFGGAFLSGATASSEYNPSMELEDGGLFLSGTFGAVPQLNINAQFLDVDGGYYRADAQYQIDDIFSAHIGYTVYEHNNPYQDESGGNLEATEKGALFGAGLTFHSSAGQSYIFAQREQVFDGNSALGYRHRVDLTHRSLIEFGFRVNSNMPNEATLSVHLRF